MQDADAVLSRDVEDKPVLEAFDLPGARVFEPLRPKEAPAAHARMRKQLEEGAIVAFCAGRNPLDVIILLRKESALLGIDSTESTFDEIAKEVEFDAKRVGERYHEIHTALRTYLIVHDFVD